MATSSLLLDGILKLLLSLWPAHATNTTSSTRCTMPPDSHVEPDPGDAPPPVPTPAFCRKRTLSAIPPTFAGVTRLTNDDASWAARLGPNGRCSGTPPASPTAAPT